MTEAERKELIQKNLRASKLKWKTLSADITERVMQGTRALVSPNFKHKSAINETEIERLGRYTYDRFPDDFKKNPTDEALDRLLGETQADIVPKWEKGLDWDSLTGKFAPNKQFELAKAVSFSKSNEQSSGELGKWLKEFNEDRANIPGVYDRNTDQLRRFGGELPPRYTGRDDEPSEEVLTQIRARNAIKGGNALIDQYNSLRKLSTRLPEGAINPFVRGSSPQSLIGAGGRYSNSPLNRIANLNVPLNNRENDMVMKVLGEEDNLNPDSEYNIRNNRFQDRRKPTIGKVSEKFQMPANFGYPYKGTPNDTFFSDADGRQSWNNRSGLIDKNESYIPFANTRDRYGLGMGDPLAGLELNAQGEFGDTHPGYAQVGLDFDKRKKLWDADPKNQGDKTDWLGWAGIGTGLLQGAGGIMDYFANMRGLELTEQAMNRKYAADDRNYLAQATALNNVIDTRKDFIDKTQGGRNTDFLQRIPV